MLRKYLNNSHPALGQRGILFTIEPSVFIPARPNGKWLESLLTNDRVKDVEVTYVPPRVDVPSLYGSFRFDDDKFGFYSQYSFKRLGVALKEGKPLKFIYTWTPGGTYMGDYEFELAFD